MNELKSFFENLTIERLREPLGLTGTPGLIASAILGIMIGFILVKSAIAFRKTVLDQFELRDGTFFQTIFASLAIGVIAAHFAIELGIIRVSISPMPFWAAEIGGMICALGLALCGQFPSATIASFGAGRIYALWALAGMLFAIPFTYMVKDFLSSTIYTWSVPFVCKDTLPEQIGNPYFYLWAAGMSAILCLFFQFMPGAGEQK